MEEKGIFGSILAPIKRKIPQHDPTVYFTLACQTIEQQY